MPLTEILERNAKEFPGKIAAVMRFGYRTAALSYQDVYELSRRVAILLEKSGVKKGDPVLLLAPNSPYWLCVFWGTLLRGAVMVPLNVQSTAEIIKKIADQTGAKVFFKHLYFKQEIPAGLKTYDVELIKEDTAGLDSSGFEKPEVKDDDIAEIMYTSGTTGDPKGVILTHANISSNLEAMLKAIPISGDDRFLSILPLGHVFEQLAGFLIPFASTAQIAYAHSPTAITELLAEHRITKMVAVPEFLRIMMAKIKARVPRLMFALGKAAPSKTLRRLIFSPVHKKLGGALDTVASGGSFLDPELEKDWEAMGIDLLQGYGLTETSPVISTNSYESRKIGSVGKILPDVEVKIASDGEIFAKGPNVFQGYFKNPAKTKEAFTADGWFKTGDIGEFDKDGFLFIRGRKKYLIKGPEAQNVYPEDIEIELNKIPGVKDSCVVGLGKPPGRMEIHAALLLEESAKMPPEKIIEEANKYLASYQQISTWSLWPKDDFPRSATRKVKKDEVMKWLESEPVLALERVETAAPTVLVNLLAEITGAGVEKIGLGTKIVPELGLDSLLRIELVSRIEQRLGAAVEESRITPETTVADLEQMIKTAGPVSGKLRFKTWPLAEGVSLLRSVAQWLLFLFAKGFVELRVEGEENLKGLSLPVVFMPNHISNLDSIVILMAMPAKIRKQVALAAAKDLFYKKLRLFSRPLEFLFNIFPFPRKEYEDIKFGLDYMGRLLDRGWSVVVHPEGRISPSSKLQPLKRGAGLIAVEMGASVVPVKITGTHDIWPREKILPQKRGAVVVRFGKPVKFSRQDSYIEATTKIERILLSL